MGTCISVGDEPREDCRGRWMVIGAPVAYEQASLSAQTTATIARKQTTKKPQLVG